jgi:hypothetical protein
MWQKGSTFFAIVTPSIVDRQMFVIRLEKDCCIEGDIINTINERYSPHADCDCDEPR